MTSPLKKHLSAIFFVCFACIGTTMAQKAQVINEMPIPNSTKTIYVVGTPFAVHLPEDRHVIFSPTFLTNASGALTGLKGMEVFSKGLGKCFVNDTLFVLLDNGKKLKLGSSNPEVCDQPISGWFFFSRENADTLAMSPIRQIKYYHGKTKETYPVDITQPDQKTYFITLKRLMGEMKKP